jgi:L-amino acid N-acyltransferase YncA
VINRVVVPGQPIAADGVVTVDIRTAAVSDIAAIAAIYAHHVRNGIASFELDAPGEQEMRRRFEVIVGGGFPYLVACEAGRVVGYAYASLYRTRPAYCFTLEDSIYLDPGCAGRGIGRRLLEALITACASVGCRQLIAVIGDSGNRGSIAVHAACGFEPVGTFRSVGFKHGRWVDSVLMQRAIGAGDATLPPA